MDKSGLAQANRSAAQLLNHSWAGAGRYGCKKVSVQPSFFRFRSHKSHDFTSQVTIEFGMGQTSMAASYFDVHQDTNVAAHAFVVG